MAFFCISMANSVSMNYEEKTYDELVKGINRLEEKYNSIETQCLKDNLTFDEFCNKAHDVKEELYFIDKYARLKQEPTITYGKEWSGRLIPIEEFKKDCTTGFFTDDDGIGYYATESSKSDIKVIPSDMTEDLYRKDFPYVLWFNR